MASGASLKLRRVVMWMGLALLCAFVLSAHVYKQNLYVRLSRESQSLEKECQRKRNEAAVLELEVKGLMRRQRLEKLAVERFGLVYCGQPEIVIAAETAADTGNGQVAMASFRLGRDKAGQWVTGAVRWLTDGL